MTQVDFYIIQSTTNNALLNFACRLIEKLYLKNQSIYVHVDNAQIGNQLDNLLWTFNDISFIPHALLSTQKSAPILIGFTQKPKMECNILINLSSEIPSFYKAFDRILEIVSQEPTQKQAARKHYRTYQAVKIAIYTHQINTT